MTLKAPEPGLFPWLVEPWRILSAGLAAGRLPQALLIHGPEGLGKTRLAEVFAQRLLCRQPAEFACGHCSACHLFHAGTHPDFIRVEPAEPGKPIPVDSIRQLLAVLALKPQYEAHRVVLLKPAHALNIHAANALLKTLEEPAMKTLMLLLSDAPSALPATILSRCQRFSLAIPERTVACAWLAEQNLNLPPETLLAAAKGAPLKALALSETDAIQRRQKVFSEWVDLFGQREDPVLLAERWAEQPHEDYLEWLSSWVVDLVRWRSGGGSHSIQDQDLQAGLQSIVERVDLPRLFELWDLLLRAKRLLKTQSNRQLLLEEVLICWWRLGNAS
jgi:DNA polymerase-3 subunit delta'